MERSGFMIYILFYFFSFVYSQNDIESELMTTTEDFLQPVNFVLWPNGTIPFYINTDHFDNEQTLAIMSSLSLLAFRTCLRFAPAMVAPSDGERVLTLANPSGARKCSLLGGNEPYMVNLGYDCLKAPWLDRIVLRALGLPFEHNRANRDNYIDVQYENIEQHAIPFFTKDFKMPAALRALPYDINSVLHFGDRDFSKNGHRTIIFKDRETKQKREGMTDLDIRKIEIIYGPECQKRDRQEKIELCHLYPGIPLARRKRSTGLETTRSLRVNPDITPPPEIDKIGLNISEEVQETLKSLDIDDEVQNILDDVHRLSVKALRNARIKYCNETDDLRKYTRERTDVLGIIQVVANYAQSMVDHAVYNLSSFCEKSESVEKYQRYSCNGCYKSYYSTKHSKVYHSTKNRPYIPQSTKHEGGHSKPPYESQMFRAHGDNGTVDKDENPKPAAARKRRQLEDTTVDLLKDSEHVETTEAMRPMNRFKREAYYEQPGNREGKRKRKQPMNEELDVKRGEEDSVEEDSSDEPESDESEDKMQRKRPVHEEMEEKRGDKYIEDRNEPESRQRINNRIRTGERQRKRPAIEEMEEKRFEKDTVEDRGEPKRGEREVKRQRKRPASEDMREDREEIVEGEDDVFLDSNRKGKMQRKRPVKESEEKKLEKDTVEDRDEPRSGEREVEREKKRPVIKDVQEEREDSAEDDEEDSEMDEGIARMPRTLEMSEENKEFYNQRRWPKGIVRYYIDRTSTTFDVGHLRQRLASVNKILRKRTCARIVEIRESETNKYEDYLVLDNSPDYVTGRVGGRQNFGSVELLKGGQHRQHTAMMVMAMLGFYFELARHDRDEYVKVHFRHIRADKLHHFEKLGEEATLPMDYDFKSATHPAWMFWRKIGKKGISTVATYKDKDPDGKIMRSFGQNKKLLSEGDIMKINTLYGTKCLQKGDEKPESKEQPEAEE